MVEIKDCWLKGSCKAKCDPAFCIKLFKLDNLYDQALISPHQRKHVNLRIDSDGSDKNAFIILTNISFLI